MHFAMYPQIKAGTTSLNKIINVAALAIKYRLAPKQMNSTNKGLVDQMQLSNKLT